MIQRPKRYTVKTIPQLADEYAEFVKNTASLSVDLSLWLPALKPHVRPLVPGELAFLLSETGGGKSMTLQCISRYVKLPSVFFEMELPGVMMYERWMANVHYIDQIDVERIVTKGLNSQLVTDELNHVVVCDQPRLSCEGMLEVINGVATDALGGQRPCVVYVDYIGLMAAPGRSRYERVSQAAESLKVLAKEANVVVIGATQMHRLAEDEEMDLHSAKDSGSIEASCGLLIGLQRDNENPHNYCWLRGLKHTRGRAGWSVRAEINGARMTIGPDRQFEANTASDDAN